MELNYYLLIMEQSFTPTTGAHLAVVNKVQDGMECLKHVQEVIEVGL